MATKLSEKTTKSATRRASTGFTDDEKAAMRAAARERTRKGDVDGESELLGKVAEMPAPDRELAERFHALVKANLPSLTSTTYYGMPAYARDGKVICWFKGAYKFKTRYATLGFSDRAKLDDGAIWPTEYALTKLTAAEEPRILALLKQAVG